VARGRNRLTLNWESAAKLAAAALLAVALLTGLPGLLRNGERPAPLPADVGLPQAPPPASPTAPAPAPAPKPKPKPKRKPQPQREPKETGDRHSHGRAQGPTESPLAAVEPPAAAVPAVPAAPRARERFGFEVP
jgi:hypothetical protein